VLRGVIKSHLSAQNIANAKEAPRSLTNERSAGLFLLLDYWQLPHCNSSMGSTGTAYGSSFGSCTGQRAV